MLSDKHYFHVFYAFVHTHTMLQKMLFIRVIEGCMELRDVYLYIFYWKKENYSIFIY